MAEPEHQQTHRTSNLEVFQRINKVEGDLGEVREQLAGMNANLQSQSQMLSRIALNQEQKSSTDWKSLAAWASVILAVVALFSTLALNPIKEGLSSVNSTIGRLQDQRDGDRSVAMQQAEERGAQREQVKSLATQIEIIREMNRRTP